MLLAQFHERQYLLNFIHHEVNQKRQRGIFYQMYWPITLSIANF